MKQLVSFRTMCAEGSQNKAPERKAVKPDPAQTGSQRVVITECKPAPAAHLSTGEHQKG